MSIIHERAAAAAVTADRIKALGLTADADLTPAKVASAREILAELAAKKHLFPPHHFPQIRPGLTGFYRLIEDTDGDNSLVAVVSSIDFTMQGLHSHAGWALIAGVAGTEYNYLYERIDDRQTPGRGEIRKVGEVALATGDVLFIPRGQIHTVGYDGTEPAINLHFYGKSTDNPDGSREFFSSADSKEFAGGPGRERPKGIPRIGEAEIAGALAAGPLEIIVLDQGAPPAHLPGALPPQHPSSIRAASDEAVPVLLVGEKPLVQAAADNLSQLQRRTILHASYEDAWKALAAADQWN